MKIVGRIHLRVFATPFQAMVPQIHLGHDVLSRLVPRIYFLRWSRGRWHNYRANNEERFYRWSSRLEPLTADKRSDLLASALCEALVFYA
jgi:hypothetical protein